MSASEASKDTELKRIEFAELKVGKIARQHILECLKNNWVTAGPKVKAFEEGWSNLCGYKHSVAVSSGTDAVINACLALYAMGKQRGQTIIVPALSFIATANAVRAAGFVPKFVDIDPSTLNINPKLIEKEIDDDTAAILVVHTMGKPCEMDVIKEISMAMDLPLIEDCCEAHYAQYKGQMIGTFGDIACFSCYTGHILNTSEGGLVCTNDDDIANTLRSTRSHGRRNGELYFDHNITGLNSKMTDLEASIGLESLANFETNFKIRHKHMTRINKALRKHKKYIWTSVEAGGDRNCPHGISITFRWGLDGLITTLQEYLDEANIHWKRNFGCIPTQHEAFADMGHQLGDFPEAEWVGNNGLHIGCHRYLSGKDINRIIDTVDKFFDETTTGPVD